MGLVAGTDVVRMENAAVDGAVAAAGAELDGDLVIRGGSVIGRDLELADGTVLGAVSLTDAAVVRGSVSLEDATVDAIELDDAQLHRRLQLLGGTTVGGPIVLERDATVGGDFVVGNTSAPAGERATVEGTIRLGDRRDAHPMSGGVSIDGSLALTGTALVEGGIRMSDVVVGEDLHVVGERATARIGAVDLFDCIVRGKVHVDGGELAGLSLQECRVGESVWIGSVDTGRGRALGAVDDDRATDEREALDQKTDSEETDNEPRTAVPDGVTIVATPVGENVLVRSARLGGLTLTDTAVNGRVDIDVVVIDGALSVSDSTIGERVRVGAGAVGSISVDESAIEQRLQIGAGWRVDADRDPPQGPDEAERCPLPESDHVAGAVTVEQSTIHGGITMDCHVATDETSTGPAVVESDVRGSVRLRPRLDSAGGVDLHGTTLPAGTIVITTPDGVAERCWYDLRGATVGDVSVEFDEGEGSAVDQLLLLETRYDGFRFSDLPGGIAGGKLHLLGDRNLTDTAPDIPAADSRIGPNATARHRFGRALSRLPLVGTGYRDDDPPPLVLEQTYLNAKNGASQVGDEDAAGSFFILEKRYRRRRLWETVAGVDGGASIRHTGGTAVDWLWNAIFDRMAVYGESPGRVVTVSGAVIALFSVFFAVLLDQPPYGDQYLGSGVLPDWVALGLQPLTLSIESFVTLVLVGPASQRLTPLVHLLGQIEGFLGVFLVALFVFTLTRSVHR
jgi:NDP-sugar pyrophosphorylase family protein